MKQLMKAIGIEVAIVVALVCGAIVVAFLGAAVVKADEAIVHHGIDIKFPCEKKAAVLNIWVDDKRFWDGDELAWIYLEPCAVLEVNVEWVDSVVVEWITYETIFNPELFRVRFYKDGTYQPEARVPGAGDMEV